MKALTAVLILLASVQTYALDRNVGDVGQGYLCFQSDTASASTSILNDRLNAPTIAFSTKTDKSSSSKLVELENFKIVGSISTIEISINGSTDKAFRTCVQVEGKIANIK